MTPKQAKTILKRHGTIATEREAKIIVGFLNKLAEISIGIYMQTHNKTIQKFDSGEGHYKKVGSQAE